MAAIGHDAGMRLGPILALLMLFCASSPAAGATDRTAALLAELDMCDPAVAAVTGPPLAALLSLADGRSATDLDALLQGPRTCIGHVLASGHGDDELVLVGSPRPGDTVGAVLWVDQGWWRIAAARIGYRPWVYLDSQRDVGRELIVGIDSGGSAGTIGLIGLRLHGSSLTSFMHASPGEITKVTVVDEDRLLIEGRSTSDRLFLWNAHAGWPGGAQWLFERRGDWLVEVANRQDPDPYYVATGFIGALFDRDVPSMLRFASADVVARALAMPVPDRPFVSLSSIGDADFTQRERMSWSALPPAARTTPPSQPVWITATFFEEGWSHPRDVSLRFERGDDAWIITELARCCEVERRAIGSRPS